MDFHLPRDGAIVILDDKVEEAIPIMRLMSKLGLPYTFYSSVKNSELPSEPLQKVRLAFLDIQLIPATSPHDCAQSILKLLRNIVPKNNGPYVIVLWSMQADTYGEEVERQLNALPDDRRPTMVLKLAKSDFMETVSNQDDWTDFTDNVIEDVDPFLSSNQQQQLRQIIEDNAFIDNKKSLAKKAVKKLADAFNIQVAKKLDVFQFFLLWEGQVNSASGSAVASFSDLHKANEHWSENYKHVIYRMAKIKLESEIENATSKQIIENALETINSTFLDAVGNLHSIKKNIPPSLKVERNKLIYRREVSDDLYEVIINPALDKVQLKYNGKVTPKGGTSQKHKGRLNSVTDDSHRSIFSGMIDDIQKIESRINTKLHIETKRDSELHSGAMWKVKTKPNSKKRKREILKTYWPKDEFENQELSEISLWELEITPVCDIAQSKAVKYRILPGVFVPKTIGKDVRSRESFFSTPNFVIDGKVGKFIFAFGALKAVDEEYFKGRKNEIVLRKDIFSLITSSLSRQVGRLGISNL
ncbi:hypothetical protein N9W89_06415 [Hellea sp.]|nr:hypothetical protein [Hellea sp.]